MIGKMLGRYELLEQLGEGGMGSVWLARLSGTAGFEKLCIVKTVLPALAKDAEFVSRFLHEGRVLTQLAHGNIAQVLDMNEADGQLFLALEYIAGVDLARLAEQVRAAHEFMPTSLVVALIAQAAEGLGAAHRKVALDGTPLHVVHRDVSPQNIMVSYEGEVKVIDFGIAKSEARSRHTAQASVMGKLGYMAPEQARGEDLDHRADQYALAIVLWELLANQPFVRRGTLTEMVVAMAAPHVRPLVPLRADVPASLEAVVLKALAPRPEGRYADTDSFARALTGELLALGPPPTKPQLGEYVKARCAQEYSSQRQLLSRVSTLRGISVQAEAVAAPAEAAVDAVDVMGATVVRSATPAAMVDQPATTDVGVVTAPSRPSVVRRADGVATPAPSNVGSAQTVITGDSGDGRTVSASKFEPARVAVSRAGDEGSANVSASKFEPASAVVSVEDEAPATVSGSKVARAQSGVPGAGSEALPTVGVSKVEPAFTTGELAAATASRRTPLVIGIAVVAVIGLGVAVAFSFRGSPDAGLAVDAGMAVAPGVDPGAANVTANSKADAGVEPVVVVAAPTIAELPDAGLAAPPMGAEEEQPSLRITGRRGGGDLWIVTNQNRTQWTKCALTVPGQRVAKVGTIPKGSSLEVASARLRFDAGARKLTKQLRLDCAEGFGLVELR